MKTSVLFTFTVGLCRVVIVLILLAMAMACPRSVSGATLRWTGGHAASANWSRPANWDTGTAPVDGDTLVFPAGAARLANNNDLAGLNLVTLRFTGAGGGYVLSGNGVFVTNGITGANVAGANTVDLARITLGADLPFNTSQVGTELVVSSEVRLNGNELTLNSAGLITLSGAIVGNGTVTKTNSGSAKLSGPAANTFNGDVLVHEGTLLMGKAGGLAIPNRLVVGLSSPVVPPLAVAENLLDDQVNQVTVNSTGLWDVGAHVDEVSDLVIQRSGRVASLPPSGKLRIGINGDVTVIASADYTTPSAYVFGEMELLLGAHEFRVEPLSALSVVASISGLGGITKTHSGTLSLKSSNSFSGLVVVKDDGSLVIENGGALGSTLSGTRLDDNAILTLIDVSVVGEKLILNSPGQADASGEFVFPALDLSAGVHSWTGDISLEQDTTIGAYSDADRLVLSGAISGPGGFTKLGRGVVRLTGATPNTYLGTTVVREGVLELGKSAAGSPAVPGMLIIGDGDGGSQSDVARNLGDDQVNRVTVNSSGYWDLGAFAEEVSALTLNQGGDVRTGPAGNLRLGIGADVVVTPSLTPIQDASRISGNLELLLGAHTFDVGEGLTLPGDATELIVDAEVTGLGGITKEGPGDMLLSGDNSYQAATKVSGGELRITSGTALGTTLTGTTVDNDATLWMQGNVQVSGETLTLNSTGLTGLNSRPALRASGPGNAWQGGVNFQINSRVGVMTDGFLDLPLALAGAGSLIKEDVGTLRFSAIDLSGFSGNIFVNEGVFELNHGFVPATIPANLGTIVVGTTNGAPHSAILRNLNSAQVGINIPFVGPYTWPVLVNGSGLWDLNGHSDFTSLLGLHQGGDVVTGPNGIIAILIGLLADSGPAPGNDPARISGKINLGAAELPVAVLPGDSTPGQRSDLIIDAAIIGGGLIKSGTGDLQLAGDNSFSGPVTVNNGTLRANHPNALGAGADPITVVSNATLWLQADISMGDRPLSLDSDGQTGPAGHEPALNVTGLCSWAGDVLFARDTRISVTPAGALDLSGALSGPGGVSKEERGTLTYSGNRPNSYSGRTTVNAGRLVLSKTGGRRHFAGPLTVGDGSGGTDADVVECASPGLAADGLTVEVEKSGLLLVRDDASFGLVRGSGHLQVDAILDVGRNNGSGEISGPITGSGVFNKYGTGALTLSNTNTISGFVAFDGRLLFSGVQSNSAVGLVGSNALIGGTGWIGPLLATEGTIKPGDATTGDLSTGNLIGKPAATFSLRLAGSRPGLDYDRVRVTGSVDLGGAKLNLSSTFVPSSGQVFTIVDNDGNDPVTGTFAGLAEGDTLTIAGARYAVSYKGGTGSNDVTLSVEGPPPPCPEPQLSIRQLTNQVELSWSSCPSNFYQLAWTTNFQQWQMLTPPLAAPSTNGVMTWTTPTSLPNQFFQLVIRPLLDSPVPTNSGVYRSRGFTHGGITRTYRLVIPESITNGVPAPLMLALHGHNQTADSFASNIPNLSSYANEAGLILVFPDGVADERGTGWNILPPSPQNPIDDVDFLLSLLDELDRSLNIDRKRIYAGGFSNGGQMCHRLAATTTNIFAAFAAVGSAVAGDFGTGALIYQEPPLEPNSILIVNATNDCKRPFWGGLNDEGSLQPPARDSVTHWTNANFCVPSPILTTNVVVTNHVNRVFAGCGAPYPPFNALKTNYVTREHYQLTCTPGTEVLFVTLTDGGHSWVEAADNVGFDTSREVLQFFLRHCRCDVTDAAPPAVPTAPGQYELRLCDQGYSRLFRLQVPAGYNPAVSAPLAFVFHGGGQTVPSFSALHPGLFAKANLENMLLVLPEALPHPMTGQTLWGEKPFDTVVDDVSFFTNLLAHLGAALNVDPLRVYAAGFSNGGEFCHWLGGTTTGLLAAIAPVCSETGWNEPDGSGPVVGPPPPLEPIAVLMVRGGLDPKRPFNGGLNIDGVECRSANDDVNYWTSGNLCGGAPVVTSAPGLMRWQYAACAGTTETTLVRVDALGHAWPDAPPFNANVLVIDFLLTHSR